MISFPENTYIDLGSNFDILRRPSRDYMKVQGYEEIFMNTYFGVPKVNPIRPRIKLIIKQGQESIETSNNEITITTQYLQKPLIEINDEFTHNYYRSYY